MAEREKRKIVVAVAPVGKNISDSQVDNPLTPEAIAEQTIACARAGAAMVHLHVRDEFGGPTGKLDTFRKTLDLIRAGSNIVIQGSTGGASNLSLEERCVSLDEPRTEVASLNMGSVNFGEDVYINRYPDIRFWAGRMADRRVLPEMEVFDLSMMETIRLFHGEGILTGPLHINFCLGFHGALPPRAEMLQILKEQLPPGARWGFLHDGMEDLELHAAALGMGADVLRVGFEDGVSWAPGKKVNRNVELVERLVALVQAAGFELATASEARAILGVLK